MPGRVDQLIRRLGQANGRRAIRAYHGSPYDWDRVDMSMVGKGEGPLDEGFGFYATEAQGAADWYRSRTHYLRQQSLAEEMRRARSRIQSPTAVTRYDAASDTATAIPPMQSEEHLANLRRLQELRTLAGKMQRSFPRGRTYELEIAYPRESLLEYDAPLYAQRPEVLAKLRQVNPQLVDDLVGAGEDGKNLYQGLGGADRNDGALFYHMLAGGNIFDSPSVAGQRRASEMLFEAGVPGHAYKNNNPNYVFYPGTEDSIRILRKYGLLAPMAAGASQGDEYGQSSIRAEIAR